jgi:hypothetical protein
MALHLLCWACGIRRRPTGEESGILHKNITWHSSASRPELRPERHLSAHHKRPALLQAISLSPSVDDDYQLARSLDCYLFWWAPLSILASLAATATRAPWPGEHAAATSGVALPVQRSWLAPALY